MAAFQFEIGSEIILPSFTIISCAAAVVRAGCIPVVLDCDPDSWNMDVTRLESLITPRSRAIMAVHIYGLCVDMNPLLEIARKYDLRVIEDAAEAIGQTYDGRPCGSFGDVSIVSFYANKHVATGEGGMVLTNDPRLAERCRSLRNLCFQVERRFVHEELGWNYRMTSMQAALGLAQLERQDEFVARKKRMGEFYNQRFANLDCVQKPLARDDHSENVYWVYGLVLREDMPFAADEAMRMLAERNIGTRPFFYPMHLQPVFRKRGLFAGVSLPVSERLATRGFYIPSGLALTEAEMDRVAGAILEVFGSC